jgi:hypothetical protein
MNSLDPKDLKKELDELRKEFDLFKSKNHIDGIGRVSLGNQILTVDRTIAISDILNKISALDKRLSKLGG